MLPSGAASFHGIDERARSLYIYRTDFDKYFEEIFKLADRAFLLPRAWSITHQPEERDDLRQETWIRFITDDPDLTKFPLCGWLYRVMRNAYIDRIRHARNQPPMTPLNEAVAGEFQHPARTEDWFLKKVVDSAIAKLHPTANEALHLWAVEGWTQEEVAELLQLPVSTIEHHIRAGKKVLLRDPQIIELMKELV